ncbi:FeoB-associated Cys-rich membrane protein [Bacillus solimangrovi]|uniref:Uncharacterized protein n=1 Tax=Bacillus solimangrovi TaxID=1305675 RepID=A0A1E5LHP2_9BACI|nr:FeoB-associated Cys-rich membrane protein [Bacillus solimangrovi]OEH93578.1 hypothetical protein BFG57_00910 [Bacillus solimangrovi]
MIVNIVLGSLIIGYASFMFVRFIKRSSKGKCESCSTTCEVQCAHNSNQKNEFVKKDVKS